MPNIVNKEVYNAIRAFNERLSYARKKYGAESKIVESMIKEAKQVVNLDWTKGNKSISRSAKNQKALTKPYEREEFSKYVMNNSASNLLEKTVYTSEKYKQKIKELSKLKGKERAKKEEELFAEMSYMKNMYSKIFGEIASDSSYDIAKEYYDKYKNGEFDNEIKLYAEDKISLRTLMNIIMSGNVDETEEEPPNFYDFIMDEE